jgi:hypothetical protein
MQIEQLDDLKRWFSAFVAPFYTEGDTYLNDNLKLKECHTHRVCDEMRRLTVALRLEADDCRLAEAIALLHDVGRFPQLQTYRTYKDHESENHCQLGVKVLTEADVLAAIDADERAVILKCVEVHGVKALPPLDTQTALFAKLIRDADKIDIYNLLVENYRILADEPERFRWEVEFPDTDACNPAVIEAVMNRQLINYDAIQTINDAKLLQLGWVYDIYFDWSLKEIFDRGYLTALIELLPTTEPVQRVTQAVLDDVRARITAAR